MAARLHGLKSVSHIDEVLAKDKGLVIVYGASDDLCEFRGAIREEFGVGGDADDIHFNKKGDGIPPELSEHEDFLKEYGMYEDFIAKFPNLIVAKWGPDDNINSPSWAYETTIPHASFHLMEDGDVYCIGIVFSIHDLK